MSWSVNKNGTRDKLRATIGEDFDRCAKMYAGTEEEQDVLAAKRTVLGALDEMRVDPDANAQCGYAVQVAAYGSRSQTTAIVSVNVSRYAFEA